MNVWSQMTWLNDIDRMIIWKLKKYITEKTPLKNIQQLAGMNQHSTKTQSTSDD